MPAMPVKQLLFLAVSVCLCVCLSVQKLKNYCSEIDVTWSEYMCYGELYK